MGELELAARGMAEVEKCQRRDGSIPAYPDVEWVCSTGMAQYAIVWYTLGKKELADKAMRYLEKIQNPAADSSAATARVQNTSRAVRSAGQ